MKKVFRPFWSYDIKQTEIWLSNMAKKGYMLVGMNRWTRCFFFRKSEAENRTYIIGYDKMQGVSLSSSLLDEGWVKVLYCGNWFVISNDKPLKEIKSLPVRDGIFKRNQLVKYLFSGLLMYFAFIALINLILWSTILFQNSPVKVVESPMWILTYSVIVIGLILSLYSVVKINKSNKYLIDEKSNTIHDFKESINKEKEKQLKRSGQIVVKRKFGWMYSPDKLENWLEEMEMQGYNLYRVSKTGTAFYFLIGIPRKVSYAIDYQTFSNESYYDMHKEVGWNKMFISPWSFQNWTIWSQEYKEGEERPQLYSDKSNHLKHARKIAITNTIMFLPLIIIYILNIRYMLDGLFTNDNTSLNIFNVIIFFICILFFGALTLRTWLYYMRLKMRYNF